MSTATVSRALQNPDVVSKPTRDAVFDAVAKTGYRINVAAKMLRQNRSGTILVVLPDIGNPFFSEILSGIEDAASAQQHTILIGNTNWDADRAKDLLGYLRNGRADGAVLMNGVLPLPRGEYEELPLVSVSEEIPNSGITHVGADNIQASADITQHLIDLDHRDIAHIAGPEDNILSKQRQQGYEQAMRAAGLEASISIVSGGFTLDAGCASAKEILAKTNRPTAVVCANDESAMGAIDAFQDAGLSVPDDISLTGFDNIAFSRVFSPALTTVHQPRKRMGQGAMKQLFDIMSGDGAAAKTVTIEHNLVIRDSTAKPRN